MNQSKKNIHEIVLDLLLDNGKRWNDEDYTLVGMHILTCTECAKIYKGISSLKDYVKEHPDAFDDDLGRLLEEERQG